MYNVPSEASRLDPRGAESVIPVGAASSAGRAPRSQRGGRGFESHAVHHLLPSSLQRNLQRRAVTPCHCCNASSGAESPEAGLCGARLQACESVPREAPSAGDAENPK